MKRIIVGLTGASGSIFFKRLVDELIIAQYEIFIVATDNGIKVFEYELKTSFNEYMRRIENKHIHICDIHDMFSKIASGSFKTEGMIILPCSMGTIGKIANGTSDNLLIRACDVQIKEKRRVLIGFREAPLSSIHLNNLLTLSQTGAFIFPLVPALYEFPKSIDDIINQIVGRILSYFDIQTSHKKEWVGL